ncbi:MAG: hypothetical protein K8R48_00105 [Alphaproteobacteria bacterium]|nr:hypothetical protein [Alphaproteobacteria bacterium]
MTDNPQEKWLQAVAAMTQEEKDTNLFISIDNLCYEQAADLLKAGARIDFDDTLAFTLRRTDDAKMALLLIDLGLTAEHVTFRDVKTLIDDAFSDSRVLIKQLARAGMPLKERALVLTHILEKKFAPLLQDVLKDGEDPLTFLRQAQAEAPHERLQQLLSEMRRDQLKRQIRPFRFKP